MSKHDILEYFKDINFAYNNSVMFDTLKDMLDELESEKQAHAWISVKDRLPNSNGCYIVWRPHFYPDFGMPSICYFDGSNTWHDSYGVDFEKILNASDVTHWMPLPEPPKEIEG